MALSIGRLVGYLDLEDKGFNQKISRSEGLMGKLGGALKKTVVGGAVAATAALGGLATTAVVKGFQRLVGIENAEAKLIGLGHTAEDVAALMGKSGPVRASVLGTAFGMDEAATAAAGAMAAGIGPGAELERVLKLTGDTATIAGTSMGEMSSIFNNVAASNKISMSEVNRLSERGVPILQMLADMYGVTQEEARKMVSESKVDFEDFSNAIEENIGGAALASGNTTIGAWKNMGAALGRVGADLLSGVFPHIKDAFGGATGMLDNLAPAAGRLGDTLGSALGKVAEVVGNAMGKLMEYGPAVGAALSEAASAAGRAKDRVLEVYEAVRQLWEGGGSGRLAQLFDVPQSNPAIQALITLRDFITTDLPAAFATVQDAVQGVFNIFTGQGTGLLAKTLGVEQSHPIIAGIQGIKTELGNVFTSIGTAAASVGPLVATVFGAIARAFGGLVAGVVAALPSVLGAFSGLMSAVSPFLEAIQRLVAFIQPVLIPVFYVLAQVLMGVVKGAIDGVRMILSGLTNVINGIIDFITGVFTGNWSQAWEGVKQIFFGVIETIVGLVWTWLNVSILGAIRGGIVKILSFFGGQGGLGGIVTLARTILAQVPRIITTILNTARSIFTSALGAIRTVVTTVFNAIRSVISSVLGAIGNAIRTYWNIYRSAFGGGLAAIRTLVSNVFTAIRSVIQSVMGAIQSVISSILNAIRSVFSSVFNAIRSLVSSTGTSITSTIRNAMNSIRSAVTSGTSSVLTIFRNLPGRIKSALGNLGKLLFSAGQDVIRGMMNGIKNMAGAAVSAVKGVVGGAISGAKKLLGISSPSKVFREIGKHTGEGLELGLLDEQKAVRRAAEAMVHVPDRAMPTFTRGDGSVWDRASAPAARERVPAGAPAPVLTDEQMRRLAALIGDRFDDGLDEHARTNRRLDRAEGDR